MTNIELTIKRLESLKPMLVKMKGDPQFERAVCSNHSAASNDGQGISGCIGPCTECIFGTDVTHDGEGDIINYGHLGDVINELKLLSVLEG